MQRVRRDDVDDVDVGVVRELMHRVVGDDAAVAETVLLFPFAGFGRRVGDDACEPAELRFLERGRDLVFAQAAEPAECPAEFFLRALREDVGCLQAQQRSGCKCSGLRDEVAASVSAHAAMSYLLSFPRRR